MIIFLQDIENQELTDILNTQAGIGLSQIPSTPSTSSPPPNSNNNNNNNEPRQQEFERFFRAEQPWGTNRNFWQVYVQNFCRIRDSETLNHRSRIYLRYLRRAPLIETIAHALEDIFHCQTNAFKINMTFSFILQHRETGEFRCHYTSNNNQLLNSPRLIGNQQDLENLIDHLAAKDFPSHLKDQRPNTKWVIEPIVSLRIPLVMTIYPLGNPPKLPDYIKKNRFIVGLEKNECSITYKDHLCFFHCLAIGKYKFTRHKQIIM